VGMGRASKSAPLGPVCLWQDPGKMTSPRRPGLSCQAESARCEFLEDAIRPSSQVSSSRRHEIRSPQYAREASSTSAALASLVCLCPVPVVIDGKLRHTWLRSVERKWGTSRYGDTIKWCYRPRNDRVTCRMRGGRDMPNRLHLPLPAALVDQQ
jgi:hypothetical protein